MERKNSGSTIIFIVVGAALFAFGAIGMKMNWFTGFPALFAILIGVGSGLFGHSMGKLIETKANEKAPEQYRRVAIEQKDERNQMINSIAKGKAFDAMNYIYSTVLIITALLNVGMVVILLLVASYLLVHGIRVYEVTRLMKEM